jgi:molybdopterin converting factor small subunit
MVQARKREKPNFDTVWAALQEVAAMQKDNAEWQKETDRLMKENAERQKETDRLIKENAERQKETSRQIGKLGNRFGEMVEYMVVPNLIAKFHELGFIFEKAYQDATIKDKANNIYAQIDITLENGDKVMIVEVKSKPAAQDIIEHLDRMEKVRCHADLHGDRRKYLGAVAGMVFNDNEKDFAMKSGFYIIEPSGETFIITVPEGGYSPREW